MDQIKEAFGKVKQDISVLQEELLFIKKDMDELKVLMQDMAILSQQMLEERKEGVFVEKQGENLNPTHLVEKSAHNQIVPAEDNLFKPLNPQNQGISIGNEGVPTDRQTDQQTDQQTDFPQEKAKKNHFEEAASMLESLDNIKKELRLKFKKLTEQEILVFSTLYQLEEELGYADYKTISSKLNLTESSIRDYVGKLIKKGIPVDKLKINNKSVHLKISSSLKKIATLSTILLLRDI